MSEQALAPRQQKRAALSEAAKNIDKISLSVASVFTDAGDFEKELQLAIAVQDLRELLTPEVMAPVMALMNTDLGFRTDRDPSQINKATGKPHIPYEMPVVRECFIESRLRGFHATGNEFNIIAGRFYGARNGFERKVREMTKGSCQVSIDPPVINGPLAKVKARATWTFNGQKQDIGIQPTDPCEFMVKINEFMGPDGAIGKAERKLYKRIYVRLTGRPVEDADPDDAINVDSTVTATPAKVPGFEGAKKKKGEAPAPSPVVATAPIQEAAPVATPAAAPLPSKPATTASLPLGEDPTPQQKLASGITGEGISFERFMKWVEETDRIDDPGSYGSFDDLPAEWCAALIADFRSLNRCLVRCKS